MPNVMLTDASFYAAGYVLMIEDCPTDQYGISSNKKKVTDSLSTLKVPKTPKQTTFYWSYPIFPYLYSKFERKTSTLLSSPPL